MLGEPNTEQFEIITEVDGETVHKQKIHDPFIRTTTTLKGFMAAWKCLFGVSITTRVNGTPGAMSTVMMHRSNDDFKNNTELGPQRKNYCRY